MLNVDNITSYKEPETLADAKAQASNQKPYKPTYATEAYGAAIDQSEDWILNPDHYDADFKPNDSNLADRVDKGVKEILSGKPDITGENNWFSVKTRENLPAYIISCNTSHVTVTCTVDGIEVALPVAVDKGQSVVFTASIDSHPHHHLASTSWSGLPSDATVSADFKTVSFTASSKVSASVVAVDYFMKFTPAGTATVCLAGENNVEYSLDDGTSWNTLSTTAVEFSTPMLLCGSATEWATNKKFVMTGSIAASGRVTALFDGGAGSTSLGNSACIQMFSGCDSLTTPPDLTGVTSLAYRSCFYMFSNCINLTIASNLSDITSLGEESLASMFTGCTGLVSAPNLSNVSSLGTGSCKNMFYGCTALTGPVYVPNCSPLVSGSTACYQMFYNSGTTHPVSATTPESKCYIIAPTSTSDWDQDSCGISQTYWTVKNSL